jgi:hypothetical protein
VAYNRWNPGCACDCGCDLSLYNSVSFNYYYSDAFGGTKEDRTATVALTLASATRKAGSLNSPGWAFGRMSTVTGNCIRIEDDSNQVGVKWTFSLECTQGRPQLTITQESDMTTVDPNDPGLRRVVSIWSLAGPNNPVDLSLSSLLGGFFQYRSSIGQPLAQYSFGEADPANIIFGIDLPGPANYCTCVYSRNPNDLIRPFNIANLSITS